MTELSFLIDLLLNHKLSKSTQALISARIKEVEEKLNTVTHVTMPKSVAGLPNPALGGPVQAASTLALMAKHNINIEHPDIIPPEVAQPPPVAVVAQNPTTAQAMASRQQAISQAISGKIPSGQDKPKKW